MRKIEDIQKGQKIFVEDVNDNYAIGTVEHIGTDFIFVKVEDTEDFTIEFIKSDITKLEIIQENKEVGRPSIGVTKKVSITLPEEAWERLDQIQETSEYKSRSELLREIIINSI